ncbi:MAG: integrase [Hyphomicrobiales bacterium]|nr:integrase [Hyphomicrobiales bacterium]
MDYTIKAPGLNWRKRKNGSLVPYWIADAEAVKAGYPVKVVNLSIFADQPEMIRQRCICLQDEMRDWIDGRRGKSAAFDGTFRALIRRYLNDAESSFHQLQPSSAHPYSIYAKKLTSHVGDRRISECDGTDVIRWFKAWAGAEHLRDPGARIPKARMVLTVLKSAVSHGVICRLPDCHAFSVILSELEFPTNKARTFAPTAAQIEAIRKAAHAAGAPRRALAYAIQFETTLRQWDVIGKRLPLSDPRPAMVVNGGEKWIGLTWQHVDQNLILRIIHGKTEETSEASGTYDLMACPMVVEELKLVAGLKLGGALTRAKLPAGGPLIIDERTGAPYTYGDFKNAWHADFKVAGLPKKMWERDLRAGGITEGGMANASIDDRSKVAGHTTPRITATIYDRDRLEAHRRVADKRAALRDRGKKRE